jgi:hypothetical protein
MSLYIKEKIKVLKEFQISLSLDEMKYIKGLRTEIAVDNFARLLIQRKLGCIL